MMMYYGELKVLQYFGYLFALFKLQKKNQPTIRRRGHRAAPSKISLQPVFDPTLIPVLVLWGKGPLPWSFHLLLVVEGIQAREVSHGSEQVIIRVSKVLTIRWVRHQLDYLKFLEYISQILQNFWLTLVLKIKWWKILKMLAKQVVNPAVLSTWNYEPDQFFHRLSKECQIGFYNGCAQKKKKSISNPISKKNTKNRWIIFEFKILQNFKQTDW